MIRILVPLILLVLVVVMAKRYLRNAPPGEAKSRRITVLLFGFALVMLLLAVTGRLHWLGAFLAALAPMGQMLLASAIDFYRQKKLREYAERAGRNDPAGKMNEAEALQILGLKKPYSENDVINAHRRLMQKLHPDRGGNDYLAGKLNEARDLLLKKGA